ncbi:hypothetical protein PG985_001513 [Apiospora marii]|uniref:Uncharacterized protein n=1 Tax=Apiospora marii TaxID=335849 RepID=A0ABR1RI88_9PEZI
MATYCFTFATDKYQNTQITYSPNQSPCGVFNATTKVLPCCTKGDTCLSNVLCRVSGGKHAGNTSGYYRPGCTDPNFPDPFCRKQCKDHTWDVVYQDDSKNWACCDDKDCNHPLPGNADLGEPFDAPSTSDLVSYYTVPWDGNVQPTIPPSSPSSPPSSPSSSPSTEPAPTGGLLSAGASAGIGIGVGLGVALAVVGAGFWLLRRRQLKEPVVGQDDGTGKKQQQQQRAWGDFPNNYTDDSRAYVSLQELDVNNTGPRELQG